MKKEMIISMAPLTTISSIPDWLFLCLSGIYLFFAPMYAQLLFLLLFIMVDAISGIMLSKKNNIDFSWKKFSITFTKIISYVYFTISSYNYNAFYGYVDSNGYVFVTYASTTQNYAFSVCFITTR